MNCQSLKWVKSPYAYSELLAVELISGLIFERDVILLYHFQPLLVPQHSSKNSFRMLHGYSKAVSRYTIVTEKISNTSMLPWALCWEPNFYKIRLGVFCGAFPKNTPMSVFTDGLLYGGSRYYEGE